MIDEKKGGNGIMGDGSYGVLFIFSFFFMDTNRGLVHTLPKYYAPKRLYCLMVYLLLYFKLSLTLYSGILVTG